MKRTNSSQPEDALGHLIKEELAARKRATKRCWGVFTGFVGLMVALAGLFDVAREPGRIVLCFVALVSITVWAQLQSRASDTVSMHDDRMENLERELFRRARLLPQPERPRRFLTKWRTVPPCRVITWMPALAFVGWLVALFRMVRLI